MRSPKSRFTIRRVMIAIAIVAVAFGIERAIVDYLRPIEGFLSGGDGIYYFDPPPWWAMIAMPVGLGMMAFTRWQPIRTGSRDPE